MWGIGGSATYQISPSYSAPKAASMRWRFSLPLPANMVEGSLVASKHAEAAEAMKDGYHDCSYIWHN